jgi:undecaprenyl-diphosphatase
LTTVSEVGTVLGGAPLLPVLVALIGIAAFATHHRRVAAFAVCVLFAESATYRVTSLLVPRDRPHVRRLEDLPADASFPSGHTAASVAVYCGLALLLTSRLRSGAARAAVWATAVALVLLVAFSRMYRGMHHPLDALGGVAVGAGAIAVLLFACRAAGAASREPSPRPSRLAVPHRLKELH